MLNTYEHMINVNVLTAEMVIDISPVILKEFRIVLPYRSGCVEAH